MSYATTTDVDGRSGTTLLARLTTESSSTTPDTAVVQDHIDGAERLIDSYLSRRYAVPVSVVTNTGLAALLRECTVDLVIYELYSRPNKGTVPEDAKNRRDNRISWLKDVAAGKADLPADSGEIESPQHTGDVAEFSSSPPRFGRSRLSGF